MSNFGVNVTLGGAQTTIPISMELYAEADDKKLSLAELMEQKFPHKDGEDSAFQQCLARTGLVLSEGAYSRRYTPTLKDIFSGEAALQSSIVRPDDRERYTPAGRFFFPAMLLEMLETELPANRATFEQKFMEMVAFTRTITSPTYDQVVIDYSRPKNMRPQVISQLAEPVRLLSISTSMVTRRLHTWAIGMEISDEAAQAATLDMVAIALREHTAAERHRRMIEDFLAVVNGDTDAGEAGLMSQAITAQSLDSSITTAGTLSQKAWVKFLMQKWEQMTVTHAVMNIDTYLAVEGRLNRPVKSDEPAVDERLNTIPSVVLPMIPAGVKILPMEDFPANLIVGLDAGKALRRVVNTNASYSAVERFVMRKSTALRVDRSERIESNGYPDAFSLMTLTV